LTGTAALESWADRPLRLLPADSEQSVVFKPSDFPELPESLTCANLVIKRGSHDYDTWRVDYPQWSGSSEVFGALGLAIVGVMLLRRESVTIRLTSSHSEIKSVIILEPPALDHETGLEVRPACFHYATSEIERHPWTGHPPAPDELPWFKLTNAEDFVVTDEHRAQRDCLHGFGGARGSARFARLLLDLSRPANRTFEVALECEAGFRGVAPASAETRLWLPGGAYWDAP
jgi:hypothetical protein